MSRWVTVAVKPVFFGDADHLSTLLEVLEDGSGDSELAGRVTGAPISPRLRERVSVQSQTLSGEAGEALKETL